MKRFCGQQAGWLSVLCLLAIAPVHSVGAAIHLYTGSGASAADIQANVNTFLSDIGGANNGVGGGPFSSGYRMLSLDAVPFNYSSPNTLPGDLFNSTIPQGLTLTTPGTALQISAASGGLTPLRFGDIDPSYSDVFQTFQTERLLAAAGSTTIDFQFFLPSQPTLPGLVRGFGAVFGDVDLPGFTSVEFFDQTGESLFSSSVPLSPNGGLSFLGITLTDPLVARGRLTLGNTPLGAGVIDGGNQDLVTVAGLFYGEPQPVPEVGPAQLLLIGLGAFAMLALLRRK